MNIIMRTFKDNIELSLKDGVGEIKMNHATIEFDGANYIITATSSEDSRLTMLSNELVNNPTSFSDYIGNSSQVVGDQGHYDFSGTVLLHTKVEHAAYGVKYQWSISSFKRVIETNEEEGYLFYVVTTDKKWRVKGLGDKDVEFEYRHNKYLLSQNNENEILIKTKRDTPYKDMVVSLLSLFQGTAMEIRCKEECKEGKKIISYLPVQYRFSERFPFVKDLNYFEPIAFKDFMQNSLNTADTYSDRTKREYMVKAIERYISSKYVDNLTKYVYLVSILEVIAEKVEKLKVTKQVIENGGKDRTYFIVCESLNRKNIDISKLNATISDCVGLNNFVALRNEILHRLPTETTIDYLNFKYPMSYLEFTVCIVILYHLGFDKIQFQHGFKLSVFKDS